MSEQRQTGDKPNISIDIDEYVAEEETGEAPSDSTIYQKNGINPAKRRRLEAMREEQELMRDIQDVFDDYDLDE
ncbi:MAG: PA3496 family putative envelope integrity protein [Neptuniibacter sp.]